MTKNTENSVYSYIIRPNRSLSPKGLVYCFVMLALAPLLIGIGFFIAGAWLVLPFAGLEILLIASVLTILWRHVGDYELLRIERDTIHLDRQQGRQMFSYEFSRHWSQILLVQSPGRWCQWRLVIRSHGREVEFGSAMTEQDKQSLAKAVKPHTGLAF